MMAALSVALVMLGLGPVGPAAAESKPYEVTASSGSIIPSYIYGPLTLDGLACPDNSLRSTAENAHWWWPNNGPDAYEYQWLRDGVEIDGETRDEYLVTRADLGSTLKLETTAIKSGWAPTPIEHLEVEVLECPTPPPAVIPLLGSATVGTSLAIGGSWDPDVRFYDHVWRTSGYSDEQYSSTYNLTRHNHGDRISVEFSYGKPGHLLAIAKSETVVIKEGKLTNSSAPKIQGKLQSGERLTIAHGKYSATPDDYGFGWLRDGKEIPGAYSRSYKLTPADVAKRISVEVTAIAYGYHSNSTKSAQTAKIVGGPLKATKKPAISGTARYGETLKVSHGTWNAPPSSYRYQWYGNGKVIRGATGTSYKLPASQIGKKISVKITATRAGFTAGVFTTPKKTVSKAAFKRVGKPSISGKLKAGQTLTVKPGIASPKATSYSYRWYIDGKSIKGATKPRYKVSNSDFGRKIQVKVTAKRKSYSSTTVASSSKSIVKAKFKKVRTPKISGTAKVGKTLTAKPGIASPKATSYSYQWYRGSKAIKNATKESYKLVAADGKRNISVRVTAKKNRYSNVARSSSKIYVKPKPVVEPQWDDDWWIYDDDDEDYWSDDSYGSGKAPNRCYAPGGKTYTYC